MAINAEHVAEALQRIYYDPASAGGYGGAERLLREATLRGVRASRKDVEDFLAEQEAYVRHRPVRRTFKRNKTYVSGIDKQWQADLAEVQHLAAANGGVRYLLTCIDVFSKYAWVVPLKSKSAPDMVVAFTDLFEKRAKGRTPARLQTDKGKEFLCRPVQTLLRQKGVHHFYTESDKKAAVVERFNRTIKTRLWRYLTAKNTKRYVGALQQLVDSYNKSFHRAIGMAPVDVRKEHEQKIWKRLYGEHPAKQRQGRSANVPQPGELVRISRWKNTFEKGYEPNWSKEVFNVHRVIPDPQTTYELRDAQDEPILGKFYAKELQRVRHGEYVVEKVLAERQKSDGTGMEVLVKWEGWSAKYNSWVDKSVLQAM